MRKFTLLLSALFLGISALRAQTVATFEALTLAHADTFYTNYTASGTDVGFNSGMAHFPCVYDTSWGGLWSSGWAYSNMTDSVTGDYTNQYAAKAAKGYAGSDKYVVANAFGGVQVKLTGAAMGHPVKGCRITNSTYAYTSMRDGDWIARKFHNGDYFLLVAKGYYHGALKPDSVGIYLANFLQPDSNNNYILRTWEWLDLEPLGKVDSVAFTLWSTDNGSFGMNTPAYFCMDDFTTYETFDTSTPPPTFTGSYERTQSIKAYPQPATDRLFIDLPDNGPTHMTIVAMDGKTVMNIDNAAQHTEINTASLPAGMYMLHITGDGRKAAIRFAKQ